jgi:hypothetical protein
MAKQLSLEPTLKTTIRLPRSLHQQLKIRAVQQQRLMADLVVEALQAFLSREPDAQDRKS